MIEPYRLSFTFGGLLFPETVAILRRYKEKPDWSALKDEAARGELLRKTREASRARYFRGIKERIGQAWPFELDLLATEGPGSRLVAFAVCCRYYRLVGDFVREVLRDKVAMKDELLGFEDYFHFLQSKAPLHPELATLSESTKAKLRQVTFRMLAEGTLIEKGRHKRIHAPTLPEGLVKNYREQGDSLSLEHLLYRHRA